jgi:hypothetical protein
MQSRSGGTTQSVSVSPTCTSRRLPAWIVPVARLTSGRHSGQRPTSHTTVHTSAWVALIVTVADLVLANRHLRANDASR